MSTEVAPTGHLAELLRLVEARAGLALRSTRWVEFKAIVAEAVAATSSRSEWAYVEKVRRDPAVFDALLVRLVIGETYFFREPRQISELRERIIPALVARNPGTLRVWSAGCASGEEPYSLSILFREAGAGSRTEVVGTDLSPRAIELAIEGVYRPWSFRGVEPSVIARYFRAEGERFRVEDEVKKLVRFARHNLAGDAFPPAIFGPHSVDLILCRNVLFYFSHDRAREIGEKLLSSLSPGGVLVTGPSDPMLRCDPPIEAMVTPGGLFYRRLSTVKSRPPRPFAGAPLAGDGFVAFDPLVRSPPASNDVHVLHSAPAEPFELAATPPLAEPSADAGEEAEIAAAFASGDWERTIELATASAAGDAAVLLVRAFANARGTHTAVDECERCLARHRFHPELTYLHATLLLDLGRTVDAYHAARQLVYLDRSLEMGHFLMATVAMRRGDVAAAGKALRSVHRIASARPADEAVPLGDGQRAGALAEAAAEWLKRCQGTAP